MTYNLFINRLPRFIDLIFILLVFIMSGCTITDFAPSGPQFILISPIPEEKEIIYIYAQKNWSYTRHFIDINVETKISLQSGGYFPYLANPGLNTIVADRNHSTEFKIGVSVEAGKAYYVEKKNFLSTQSNKKWWKFELVPEKEALPLLKDTVLLTTLNSTLKK